MNKPIFSLIVCCDKYMGIGIKNKIPWKIPKELELFKYITSGNIVNNNVVMGYNTWESLPKKSKPLKNRKNIILTRNENKIDELYQQYNNSNQLECFNSLNLLIDYAFKLENEYKFKVKENKDTKKNIFWIIGGKTIYEQFLYDKYYSKLIDGIIMTKLNKDYYCNISLDLNNEYLLEKFNLVKNNDLIFKDLSTNEFVPALFQTYIAKKNI